MKFVDMPPSKGHHVLLFGPPKSGKTKLLGGVTKGGFNLHLFDAESGSGVLRQLPREQQERINAYPIRDTKDLPIAVHTFLKVVKGGRFEICDDHGLIGCAACKKIDRPFSIFDTAEFGPDDVIGFDSLTQFTNSAHSWIGRNQDDEFKFGFDEWANSGRTMDRFLSEVQASPFNICCISHETETEMEDGKTKLVATAGTSRFSRNTAKYFDEVMYCEVKNGKHVVGSSTTYSGRILTGSRSGAMMEKYEDPTDALVAIFRGTELPPVEDKTPAQAAAGSLKKLSLSLKK